MTIKIVTDSTCDLPQGIIEQYDISVIPLYINIGAESYLDGVDMTRRVFYDGLPEYDNFPKTAVPGPGQFSDVYNKLADEGATAILSIHISPSLSAVTNSARIAAKTIAAKTTNAVEVTVLDSGQLSLGLGFIVQKAAQLAADGQSTSEIINTVESLKKRTYVFAALQTTDFLRRSGRISGFQNNIGTLLQIKPILKMYNGEATSERIRTSKKAIKRLINLVEEIQPIEQIALIHTNDEARAYALWQQSHHLFPDISEPISVMVTPVIGAHIGPGAVGFACLSAEK